MTPDLAPTAGETLAPPSLNLTLLLAMQAAMQPRKPFLLGVGGRSWTFGETEAAAAHLGWLMRELGAQPGAPVLAMTPNSDRAAIAVAGLARAGFLPLLAPPGLSFADGFAVTTAARPVAIIAENGGGADTLAAASRLAAASASVRFLLGFGENLPRGMTDLGARFDAARGGAERQRVDDAHEAASVIVAEPGGRLAERPLSPLLTACVELGAAAALRSGDRIVSPLAPDDPAGLTAGLFAGLFAGAELALLDAPTSQEVARALDTPRPRHLVWPAAMAEVAAEIAAAQPLRSLILRRRAPHEAASRTPLGLAADRIVDLAAREEGDLHVGGLSAAADAPTLRQARAAR